MTQFDKAMQPKTVWTNYSENSYGKIIRITRIRVKAGEISDYEMKKLCLLATCYDDCGIEKGYEKESNVANDSFCSYEALASKDSCDRWVS